MSDESLADKAAAAPPPSDPDRFFSTENKGLLAQTLADAVREHVQLGQLVVHRDTSENDVLWHYAAGVWRLGAVKEIERACSRLLGERVRAS